MAPVCHSTPLTHAGPCYTITDGGYYWVVCYYSNDMLTVTIQDQSRDRVVNMTELQLFARYEYALKCVTRRLMSHVK